MILDLWLVDSEQQCGMMWDMTNTRQCKHCGATFQGSRAGYTVHCPAHRTAASRRKAPTMATGAEHVYRVYFDRPNGVQGDTVLFARGQAEAMRAARERVPMGATIRGVVDEGTA